MDAREGFRCKVRGVLTADLSIQLKSEIKESVMCNSISSCGSSASIWPQMWPSQTNALSQSGNSNNGCSSQGANQASSASLINGASLALNTTGSLGTLVNTLA